MSGNRYRFTTPRSMTTLLTLTLIVCMSATGLTATRALAQSKSELKAKAQTITSKDFLKAPEKFDTADVTIAKTAPTIEFVQIPLPDMPANPWSIWGYSLLHSNGKVYIPLGNHLGIDADSFIYEYDPQTKTIRQVADVLSAAKGYKKGDFGYGKIHGRLSEAPNGDIYFATYWGQWNKMPDNSKYEGDRVFRYNPKTEKLADMGMPKFGWGFPSTNMAEQRMLFYAEAHSASPTPRAILKRTTSRKATRAFAIRTTFSSWRTTWKARR